MAFRTREVLAEAAKLAARGEPYVLATVVWRRAPTSAVPGAKALITADGRLRGWIGGGCSEPVVIREALRALEEGTPRLLHLAPPEELSAARAGVVLAPIGCAGEGALEVFVEPHVERSRLFVIGGAPVAETLAAMAGALGFDVQALDPGEGGGGLADQGVAGQLDLEAAGAGPTSFIVVATLGRYDEAALEAALATEAGYVGLVGSRKRAESVLDSLRSSGVNQEQLARVRAPAGLDLGRISHEEIAVAILAEIVQIKAAARAGLPPVSGAEGLDPVCGMSVAVATATFTAERDGRTYYFCSDGCRRRFAAEPTRYVTTAT